MDILDEDSKYARGHVAHLDHVSIPPRASVPHLEKQISRAPDIDFGTVAFCPLTAGDFGCGPGYGTAHWQPRGLLVVGTLSVSETGEFADAARVDEDIVGFNVLKRNGDEQRRWACIMMPYSVNNVTGMQIYQRVKDLGSERLDQLLVEPAILSQTTSDRRARKVFHESIMDK